MRGYAAIVGVFWQKRRFLPDRATLGLRVLTQFRQALLTHFATGPGGPRCVQVIVGITELDHQITGARNRSTRICGPAPFHVYRRAVREDRSVRRG